MTRMDSVMTPQGADSARAITKLVVMAVGGQGGGVLTGWIEAVARAAGRAVQATSVAGVAQRTGATIYYIEIAPEGVAAPVFSLAPAAGDVDILIAAELMEAGRAIQRGFVTPDRTVLIASEHRALAVSEKMVPGNGIAQADEVKAAAGIAAQRFLSADMERLAVAKGSVISASLFGALAGSGALPFPRDAFEAAIRNSGKGVEASLAAFAAGFEAVRGATQPPQAEAPKREPEITGPASALADWAALMDRVEALPEPARDMARAGLQKVVAFQDCTYGAAYLDHLERIAAMDHPAHDHVLTHEAAKYVANAMAYDDVIRVADRKTRAARRGRIDTEMGRSAVQEMQVTEFLHPRAEEISSLLPAGLGARVQASEAWMARLDRWFNRGRRIRSDRVSGFLQLYLLAGLRGYRRRTLRHAQEQAHLEAWLKRVTEALQADYDLAVEILRCRRLIKGYSDTHARGLSKFDLVMAGADLVAGRADAADWVRRLREAALQDEEGKVLDGALQTVRSFAG
ncbi:indolepyruvate oxidoreductase subunit beta family protein [Ruegeria aquimaris]|uniref:Indolepyruvate oxidoreductase subunit beta family protein n=1 Tax=Ruegeria aquimaris TaxID=2984333 RepID=A0ABT3AJB0_9RHOB|nr:indolepyruvate oxidoreductase subunit beta family protein [Ruegeria sp. XHP0148]MCV2888773.1 indolepyruvate oxidoreductase subunit beta family protein [Ruegeria sp. XHP0148]